MKKKIIILLISILTILVVILLSKKWETDIIMESIPQPPNDKIDLQIMIDNEIVFNDTLSKNPFDYPTHIEHPMRIGFHTISMYSKIANLQKSEKFFLLFNQHLALYYGNDSINNNPVIHFRVQSGEFYYE